MRVASLEFFFLGNWSHFPGSSLLGNFGYWVVPTLDPVRIFWKYFICLFVYTINQSSLAQIANSVSPSVRDCSHLIFIFRDCYGSLGLSCTCQLRREPWHCGKIPFPALSSSGFSSSLQLHVLWPTYPDSFGQNTGFLWVLTTHVSTMVQLHKWVQLLQQSCRRRERKWKHPHTGCFPSPDSPTQSACFCLLFRVLRYLIFALSPRILVVVRWRNRLE